MPIRIPMTDYAEIPAWTYEGQKPSVFTFFSAITLADLEGKLIRVAPETQRALLGCVVFGKRSIQVNDDSTVTCMMTTDFGRDWEIVTYSHDAVQAASDAGRQLHPTITSPKYFDCDRDQRWCGYNTHRPH